MQVWGVVTMCHFNLIGTLKKIPVRVKKGWAWFAANHLKNFRPMGCTMKQCRTQGGGAFRKKKGTPTTIPTPRSFAHTKIKFLGYFLHVCLHGDSRA